MKSRQTLAILIFGSGLLVACASTADRSGQAEVVGAEGPAATVESIEDYPLIPLQALLAPASFDAPQISPDGKLISFIAPLDGVPNFFVAPVDDIDAARPVTRHSGSGVRATDVSGVVMYRWHYDSKHIIYPMDYDGDENWDIHVVDVETGEDRNLTPLEDYQVQIIAYGRTNPNEALVSIDQMQRRQPDVYRLNLESGEYALVLENEGHIGYVTDNALELRLAAAITPQGGLDLLRRDEDGQWVSFYRVAPDDMPALTSSIHQKIIRFDGTNEHLYLYDSSGRDTAALVALDMATGEVEVIAEDERVDIGGVLYHPIGSSVQGYATDWTRNTWNIIDDSIAADAARLGEVADGDWTIVSRSDDDRSWIVRYMLSHEPITFYVYDRHTSSATRLFSSTPQLEGLKLSKMHPYVFTTEDGFDLVSYVVLPPWTDADDNGRPDEPVPVVVLVHGGPSDERARFAFGPVIHWLANRGYGVLYVNFRGSAGFGKEFMNAANLEWGGKMHEDVVDQVKWAIAEGIADPDRVAILGGSYGGYEVLVGMTMTPDVFACGVDIVGPSNLEIPMPHWDPDQMARTIGDPRTAEGRALLRSRSPINFADQTKNPVLIGQGANDSRVPQDQSDTVVDKMVRAGAEVTYVVFPDEGHGFLRTENRMAFFAIVEAFFGQCLGGRYEPISSVDGSSMQVPVGVEHIPGLAAALAARTDTGMPEVAEVSREVLASYVGSYELVGHGLLIAVTQEGENIYLQVPGQPKAQMFPSSKTEFFFKVAPSTVEFFHSEDGSVSHLVLYSQGSQMRADRVN